MKRDATRYRNAFWIILAVATLTRLALAGRFEDRRRLTEGRLGGA